MVAAIASRFRHHAATADALLCFYAAALATVPVDTLAASLPACSGIPAEDSAAATSGGGSSGSIDTHGKPFGSLHGARRLAAAGGSKASQDPAGTTEAAGLQAGQAWLQRLQQWLHYPGVPLLRLEIEPADESRDPGFWKMQLIHEQSPYLVCILTFEVSICASAEYASQCLCLL